MTESREELRNMNFSFMGKGCVLSGKFSLCGPTHLASHLEGELKMSDASTLIIEPEGSFEGHLHCHDIEIFGRFEGTLVAAGTVTLHSCANIFGEIEAKNLIIHPGATVNIEGRTQH